MLKIKEITIVLEEQSDIEVMLEKQAELDAHILEKNEVTIEDGELFKNTVLAFNVELAELANEVRTFKHWTKKPPSAYKVALEEYVDALHFLLSMTNQLAITSVGEDLVADIEFSPSGLDRALIGEITKSDINTSFMGLFSTSTELFYSFSEGDTDRTAMLLLEIWEQFALLGAEIGFEYHHIIKAYEDKMAVNYQRQEQGY